MERTDAAERGSCRLLTPITEAGLVDRSAVGRLVTHAVPHGVRGISPLGSTGEGYTLDLQRRLDVLDAVRAAAPARTPSSLVCSREALARH